MHFCEQISFGKMDGQPVANFSKATKATEDLITTNSRFSEGKEYDRTGWPITAQGWHYDPEADERFKP